MAKLPLSQLINGHARLHAGELRAAVSGSTVLVTGASFGIGEATTRHLVAAGATVLAVARTADRLDELAAELADRDGSVVVLPCDLTDFDAVGELGARVLADHGPPDVLVNNAGRSIRRSIADSTDRFHDFQRTIDINYLAPVRLTLALLPAMRERGSGHLVAISTSGVRGLPAAPGWSAYQSSKAAFDTWTRSVAQEISSDGVATTSVYFGLVRTRMSAPTAGFNAIPGQSPKAAGWMVCDAIVHRPRSAGPWWIGPADVVTNGVLRRPTEAVLTHAFRRGEKGRSREA
ncbi:MAG: SDR family NAD(P)-dependent oxidoreductase [Solirubrobacteraceae bacterium]|nr:SDR family NAD(P)-dependent oxidoreductase [Solirubrobacteraceae bacterium]